MIRAVAVRPAGEASLAGTSVAETSPADACGRVLIDFDGRFRRRIVLRTEEGEALLLDLARAVRLRDGDRLVLEDGRTVVVEARAEPLLDIHAPDMAALVRIVWHLGNRHLPVQLLGDHVRIREDHVIADMVRGLGGHVRAVAAPFDPEAGAYAGDGGHHHHHGHHHHDDE